ncbi:hypothetical protein HWE05_26530 [Caballeronia zhejiangensis]|jgi:hypothetical protein|nr:hypothetical protein [Caballeronia zhejiangensis]
MKPQEAGRRALAARRSCSFHLSWRSVMKTLVLLCACLAWTGAALATDAAEAPVAASSAAPEPKTLKERLGDKASDDQRVDNCHVPADRRGTKVRPDKCMP